jgi:ribosome maturation factor RimP
MHLRGPKVPSFIVKKMIAEKQLFEIVNAHLDGTSIFPVEVKIRSGNRLFVFIDGDQGVTIDDCKALNRYIESQLDRETEDYDLTVSTAGADNPLRFPRQYPRHVGRELELKLADGTVLTGKLIHCDLQNIEIEPASTKKDRKTENIVLAFSQITEARIKLSFKK